MRKKTKLFQIRVSEDEANILENNMFAAGYTNRSRFLRDLWSGEIHLHAIAESYYATVQSLWLQTNNRQIKALLEQWVQQPTETTPRRIDPEARFNPEDFFAPVPTMEP